LIVLKNYLYWKVDYTENCLNSKFDWMKKLLGFKNWLHGKIACTEKLLGFKNWLDGKTTWIKKLLILKNCSKHPKRKNKIKWNRMFSHICPIIWY